MSDSSRLAQIDAMLKSSGASFGKRPDRRKTIFTLYRALDRIFDPKTTEFQLKGGSSLLLRRDDARFTRDIDLLATGNSLDDAEQKIATLMGRNLDDGLTFTLEKSQLLEPTQSQPSRKGRRLTFRSYWGTKPMNNLKIELVQEKQILPQETTEDSLRFKGLGLVRSPVQLFPLAHQVAQKVCGCIEMHKGLPSSRSKDLLDLCFIAVNFSVDRNELTLALDHEIVSRGLDWDGDFKPPPHWSETYPRDKKRFDMAQIPERFDQAVLLINKLVTPVSTDNAGTRWDPNSRKWVEPNF